MGLEYLNDDIPEPDSSLQEFRHAEQAGILYRNAPLTIATNLVTGLVLVGGFWDYARVDLLGLWYAAMTAVVAARMYFYKRYQRREPDGSPGVWLNGFALGAGASGLVWGSAVLFLVGEYGQWQTDLLTFLMAGMTAGAVASSSAFLPAVLAFNIPALFPLAAYFLLGGTPAYWFMGALLVAYTAATGLLARNLRVGTIDRSLSEETTRRLAAEQQLILEHAHIGIAISRDRKIVRSNKFFRELFGWSPEELPGRSTRALFLSESDYDRVGEVAYSTMAAGQVYQAEHRMRRRDGSVFWCRFRSRAINPGKPLAGSIWLMEDVSYQRDIEDQLRRLTVEQDMILEGAQVGIVFVRERTIVRCNKFYADLMGYSQNELQGLPTRHIFVSEEGYEEIGQSIADNLARGERYQTEFEIRRKDGSSYLGRVTGALVNPESPAQGSIWLVEDVTEIKKAEAELRASEDQLRRAVADAPIPLMIHAEDGEVLMVGRQWTKLTGYDADDIKSYGDWREKAFGDRAGEPSLKDSFDQLYAQGADHGAGEQIIQTKDGRSLTWDFRASPLGALPDGRRLLITMGVDVTERIEMERSLQRLSLEQSTILENAQIAMALVENQKVIHANSFFENLFRLEPGAWKNMHINDFFPTVADAEAFREEAYPRIESERVFQIEHMMKRQDGSLFWGRLLGKSAVPEKPLEGLIWVVEDFSERKQFEHSLQISAAVFDAALEGIVVTDAEHRVEAANGAFCEMVGYAEEELIGKTPQFLRSARHEPAYFEEMWDEVDTNHRWSGEIWRRCKDGREFPSFISITAVCDEDGKIQRYVTVSTDITRRKEDERKIWRQANFDPLTGLPNRSLFLDRLSQEVAKAQQNGSMLSLLFMDLDRFKAVNDTLGHPAGDQLLCKVANRLTDTVRDSDTVARMGGDEFIIILPEINSLHDAEIVAEKVLLNLRRTFLIEGQEVSISGSIGITVFPADATDVDSLFRNADNAMYRAKEAGSNQFMFYTPDMSKVARERSHFERELRQALQRRELELLYQPIIDLESGEIRVVEALLRWQNPELGLVLPENFIPVTEDTGLIISIGEWVLYTACKQAMEWHGLRTPPVSVAVNVSARQFSSGNPAAMVSDALELTGLPPECLELEITERLLLEDNEQIVAMLNALSELGVQLSIDDFGTGYSALSYLKQFNFDVLKIDGSFVGGVTTSKEDAALATAIISLAKAFDVRVVAEGVELKEQADFLRAKGCDLAQGFYFGKPMTAAKMTELIARGAPLRGGLPHLRPV